MRRRSFSWLMVLGLCAGTVWAQGNFVYTNNDTIPNTVSGFAVGQDGVLTEVPGSPFLSGADGAGDAFRFFASNRIRVVGNFLYASNCRSNSVSGFSIDLDTGSLTPVPGSPFATGAVCDLGITLAASPDGQFVYAGSHGSRNIRVFRVGSEGELTALGALVPAGGDGVNGSAVSPDGKWLVVVLSYQGPHGSVAMFRIEPETGEVSPVPGSPFPVRDPGGPDGGAAGVDVNCASDTLFVGEATRSTTVDILSIDPDTGAVAPTQGSPFMPGVGVNSNVPLLSPDDSLLFVSNQANAGQDWTPTITVFTVTPDGSLTLMPGSPFPVGGGVEPAGMATDQAGTFLYVAVSPRFREDPFSFVGVFSVDLSGQLTPAPGSPFPTGRPNALTSLAAFPSKTCTSRGKSLGGIKESKGKSPRAPCPLGVLDFRPSRASVLLDG